MDAFFAAEVKRRFAGTSIRPLAATDPEIERVADCARRNFVDYSQPSAAWFVGLTSLR